MTLRLLDRIMQASRKDVCALGAPALSELPFIAIYIGLIAYIGGWLATDTAGAIDHRICGSGLRSPCCCSGGVRGRNGGEAPERSCLGQVGLKLELLTKKCSQAIWHGTR